MSSLLLILLSAVLVCHYGPVLLGGRVFQETDPFSNAVGVALASSILLALIAPLSFVLEHAVLRHFEIGYLHTFVLVILIMTLVQLIAMLMPGWGWTPIRPAFVMLMTAHAGILGSALLIVQTDTFSEAVLLGLATGLAFGLMLLAFTTLHRRVLQANVPRAFRDAPIALISTGLMALAFMGLIGLVRD
ncbi:MAG TPA: Rnf-Nqr domain containing protein [Povalibacter sp.]|nr:Rnf-Nqr domain containing protein [Povalibacter sp.]